MYSKFFTVFLFIFLAGQSVKAQISISSTELLNMIGTTQTFGMDSSGSITVDLGAAAGNQTWDFSNYSGNEFYDSEYRDPDGTPFDDDFPTANFVQFNDFSSGDSVFQIYSYVNIAADMYQSLGSGSVITIPGEIDTTMMEADDETIPLPITYQLQWTDSSADTTDFSGTLYITTTKSVSTVDAWGTITVPGGTFECLRVREDYTSSTKTVVGGIEFPVDSSSNINYVWITEDNFLVCSVESQEGETNPDFTNAAYVLFLASGTTAISDAANDPVVHDFQLEQNYPNPFNPVTTISFTLSEAGPVNLSVYNSAGQLVQNLVEGHKNAGKHTIEWNADRFASGVYYYKLSSSSNESVKKSILVK